MSGRIPQHFIDELVARADIVELISSRVPPKKNGKDYKSCCPSHNENTPSFHVVPDKGFYHCFGCQAKGNVLDFAVLMSGQSPSDGRALKSVAVELRAQFLPNDVGDTASKSAKPEKVEPGDKQLELAAVVNPAKSLRTD